MRIDVKKFLFLGLEKKRHSFFEEAQKMGMIQFIDKKKQKLSAPSEDIQTFIHALKIVRGLPTQQQTEVGRRDKAREIAKMIVQLREKEEKLLEEKRTLGLEIARVEMFGDFSQEDVTFIEQQGDVVVQFFWAKEGIYRDRKETYPRLIYLRSDHGLDYFVGINREPVQLPKMVEIEIDQSVGELKKRLRVVDEEWSQTATRLKEFAKYEAFLRERLLTKLNAKELTTTQTYAEQEMEGSLFTVEGWVPVNQIGDLMTLATKEGIHLEAIALEKQDQIPTYLENQGTPRIGQDLVQIYDTPSIYDKDPSTWVLWSFAFFFAFIINDAGYGAIFLAIALYLHFRFIRAKGGKKRLIRLVTILATTCFLWGVLTTSFFGIHIGPENPLRKISLTTWLAKKKAAYHMRLRDDTYKEWITSYPQNVQIVDPNEFINQAVVIKEDGRREFDLLNQLTSGILFELAILTGVIHLICSLARNVTKHWAAIGWIFFLVGGYLYFPTYLGISSLANSVLGIDAAWGATLGLEFLIGGFIGAILLAFIQTGLMGILEAMNVIQVFGDTLSYVRLYALGLASGILSETINEIAGAVPYFIAAGLILASHAVNILLSIMGGVIHGLRLNFLEWYHYSFEGGGKPFRPLHLLKKEYTEVTSKIGFGQRESSRS